MNYVQKNYDSNDIRMYIVIVNKRDIQHGM